VQVVDFGQNDPKIRIGGAMMMMMMMIVDTRRRATAPTFLFI
jgi:hypothetical protein